VAEQNREIRSRPPPPAPSNATVRSISRNASRSRAKLRKRAISGNNELEIGLTSSAIGTPTPRMQ
jgi:hypothetical protein